MGYDFTFVRLRPRPESLPFRPAQDFDGSLEPFDDQDALRQRLLSPGGFRLNGPTIRGIQSYWWDTPDGGSLDIFVRKDAVSVDTHSHWRYVLEVYELLRALEPELLILDPQSVLFHDADSYRKFVEDSYARKT